MTTLPMAPPLYPRRELVQAGECGTKPLKDLERWARGLAFHPYGIAAHNRLDTIEESLQEMREHPMLLEFTGVLATGGRGLNWSVRFRQIGDPDSHGLTSPHMTAEDAAYAALALIEPHEREAWETALVVGHA